MYLESRYRTSRWLGALLLALTAFPLATCTEVAKKGTSGDTISGDAVDPPEVDAAKPDDTGSDDSSKDEVDAGRPELPGDLAECQEGENFCPCKTDNDCFSEWCVEAPEGEVCTKTCDDIGDCPSGWSCELVTHAGGDVTSYICLPYDTYLCRPCLLDSDCNAPGSPQIGVCLTFGKEDSYCVRDCDDEKTCPDGFECAVRTGPDGQKLYHFCLPANDEPCTCTARFVAEGATTNCERKNGYGTCTGLVQCLEVGPVPECSALEPSPEVCDGVDNDCDGETDVGASDCVPYYLDVDGDGYGQQEECACSPPGPNWKTQGGDCNELVADINPGANEICGGPDEDCDGEYDEEGAQSCEIQYLDNDDDGYGQTAVSSCTCSGTPGWADEPGDCDDFDTSAHPDAVESCDFVDNDCDGVRDEENSEGCYPFFLDFDGDGYGLTEKVKCLCGPLGLYLADKPGDCADAEAKIHPGVPELCNGIDDDCDEQIDEGEPNSMCPSIAHASAGCVNGTCGILDCDEGWADVDEDPLTGCECAANSQQEGPGAPGQTCQNPIELGMLNDSGASASSADNVVPADDVDWYKFTALDSADTNGCDKFNARVEFIFNPQEQFVFDVFKGSCAASDELCKASQVFTDRTDFHDGSVPNKVKGECPCGTDVSSIDNGTRPDRGYCTDNTATYYVKVYRAADKPASCAEYTIRVSNGL